MEEIYTKSIVVFDDIYKKYHVAVYKNILKYIKNEQVADDIFQDVFTSFWEALRDKKEIHSASSWLYVVSHNKALSFLKKAIKTNQLFSPQEINETLLNEHTYANEDAYHETTEMQLQLLYRAVDTLPQQKRIVFCLNKFEGKEVEEIAQILDISPLSVKEYLKQGTRAIKAFLNQNPELIHNSTIVTSLLMLYIQC